MNAGKVFSTDRRSADSWDGYFPVDRQTAFARNWVQRYLIPVERGPRQDYRRHLSGVTPGAVRRRLDPEVVELFAGPELRSEPPRLLAATGPGLGGFSGISIFGKHLGVGAPRMAQLFGARPVVLAELV